MRKFYSIVLMAAALLVGTNAWAVTLTYNSGAKAGQSEVVAGLQLAVNKVAAGDSATITLDGGDLQLAAVVSIPAAGNNILNVAGPRICIDMNNTEISETGLTSGVGCFRLVKGTLHITGFGTINHNVEGASKNVNRSAITVFGAPWEKKTENWSNLIIDEDVTITTVAAASQYGITLDAFCADATLNSQAKAEAAYGYNNSIKGLASAPTDKCSAKNSSNKYDAGCAYGVRIIIDGDVYGYQRGINIAGNINASPECDTNPASLFPYIKIGKEAEVSCNTGGMTSGNGGIYAGGYTIMDINGYVHGQTGILVKSGDITLTGAQVASDSNDAQHDGNYKGNVSGTGLFIASDAGYAGDIKVSVEGGTTVTGGGYAAIVDVCATNTNGDTQVENLDIKDGIISGGQEGAIILTPNTAVQGTTTIINATVTGDIMKSDANGNNAAEMGSNDFEKLIPGTVSDDPADESDYIVSAVTGDEPGIKVEPNLSKLATTNAYGYTTFSTNVNREVVSGVTAYKAQYNAQQPDVLTLVKIQNGIIPAGNGVLLIGEPNTTYALDLVQENQSDLEGNDFRPASEWDYRPEGHTFFVLSGNLLYKYTGSKMKEHKAYLDVEVPAHNAPARFRFVFAEEDEATAIENVEVEAVKAEKFIENGQLFIRRGENLYNVQGQIVK